MGRSGSLPGPGESRPDFVLCRRVELHRRTVYYSGRVQTYVTIQGVCFSRRRAARLDAMPLNLEFGQDHELTLKYFEKMIAEAIVPRVPGFRV